MNCGVHEIYDQIWTTEHFRHTLISLRFCGVGKSYAMRGFKLRMYSTSSHGAGGLSSSLRMSPHSVPAGEERRDCRCGGMTWIIYDLQIQIGAIDEYH